MALGQGIRAGAAYVELFVNDNKLVRGLKRAQMRLRRFGASAMDVGRRMMVVGAMMAAPFAIATRIFSGFDDAMRKTKAVTSATDAEFRRLTATAKELGQTTSYTAAEVANAMTELGRAGFKPKQIDAAIGGILSLARATDTELSRAAEIAGNALRGFGMEVDQIDRVVDVLSYTANNSAQTLDDLGESMKYVAPLAAEAGEPIESVAAALGVLANAGIKGSMAGTATARALKNLAKESNQKTLAKLGVQAVDAAGDLRPLGDILADLGKRAKDMGSAKRLSIFETLFGRGQAAALKLASDPNALSGLTKGLQKAGGYAKKTAEEMDDGIGGTTRRLNSAVEGVFIRIGKAIERPLVAAMEAIIRSAQKLGSWIERNSEAVALVAKLVLGVIRLGAALLTLGLIIKGVSMAMGAMAFVASPLGAVLTIVGAAVAGVAYLMGRGTAATEAYRASLLSLKNELSDVRVKGDELRAADLARLNVLKALAEKGKLDGDQMAQAGQIIAELTSRYGKVGLTINKTTGTIDGMTNAIGSLSNAMRKIALNEIDIEMTQLRGNLEKLHAECDRIRNSEAYERNDKAAVGDFRRVANDYGNMAGRISLLDTRREKLQLQLRPSDKALAGKAAGGIAAAVKAKQLPDAKGDAVKEGQNADELGRLEQEWADKLRRLKLEAIDDEAKRRKAMIDDTYKEEICNARELGATQEQIENIKSAHKQELANVATERKRDAAENNQQRGEAIEELKLRAKFEGIELERALLNLEEQRAIKKAKAADKLVAVAEDEKGKAKMGESEKLVKQEFALKRKMLKAPARVTGRTAVGLFNAKHIQAMSQPSTNILRDIHNELKDMQNELKDMHKDQKNSPGWNYVG